MRQTSPILVTRKAFLAAEAALADAASPSLCLKDQNPMSRYEHSPMTSQKMNISRKLLETMSPSIPVRNRETSA